MANTFPYKIFTQESAIDFYKKTYAFGIIPKRLGTIGLFIRCTDTLVDGKTLKVPDVHYIDSQTVYNTYKLGELVAGQFQLSGPKVYVIPFEDCEKLTPNHTLYNTYVELDKIWLD